jgi:hypothetical protein
MSRKTTSTVATVNSLETSAPAAPAVAVETPAPAVETPAPAAETPTLEAKLMTLQDRKQVAFERLAARHRVESLEAIADLYETLNARAAYVGGFVKANGYEISGAEFRKGDKGSIWNNKTQKSRQGHGLAVVEYHGWAISADTLANAPLKFKDAVKAIKQTISTFKLMGIKQDFIKLAITDESEE